MSSKTYVGTKAFGIKGTLLDPGTVKKLAEAASLEELVNRLRSTPYSGVLSGISPPFEARKIELALRERLAAVHNSINTSAGKYEVMKLYYLRHIAWDLKIALKAKALGRSFEETVEYLDMKAEELVGRRDLLVKVLSSKDLNEAVAALSGTEFHADIERAFASYQTNKEARFFDLYIDHTVLSAISKEYSNNFRVYASPRATDVAGVGAIVSADVDAYNVLSILRSKLWGLPEAEAKGLVITPTHRVTSAVLARMAGTESVQEAVKLVESSYHVPALSGTGDEQLIDSVEDWFVHMTKETASKAFYWQGLGPGTTLALIKLLEFEVGNLAAIAIGVETRMEPRVILSKLHV
ncbi:MAG: V-type ATPase subunit [Thaumarchaeota archaeon]|nr:V-type ATPase subunit [Nitrososphaerota archaeon]